MPLLTKDSAELAQDYDRISATRQFKSGRFLVDTLSLRPGERVLDVGCGTGLLAEYMADRVGPSGRVLGIEPLPLRISLAEARRRPCLSFCVGDAYTLDEVGDGAFDVVCLNAVFHWLPEKTGPLRQFARILAPGGRLGISTALKGFPNLLAKAWMAVLARPPFAGHPRDKAATDHRVDEVEMRGLLEATGFAVALLETRRSFQLFPTPEAVLRHAEASSFGNFLAHLPEALRPMARSEIAEALAAGATREGIPIANCRIVAIARKERAAP